MTRKIFILQDMPNHDYSPAGEFGDLVFVGDADLNSRFGIVETPGNISTVRSIVDVLTSYVEGDAIVVDGNPIMVAAAIQFVTNELMLDANLLKWDNRRYAYIETAYPVQLFDQFN